MKKVSIPKHVNRILLVKNLPYTVAGNEIYELFGKYGAIRQVRIGNKPETKGTAFVVFEDLLDAKNACEHLSGFNVQGRYLQFMKNRNLLISAVVGSLVIGIGMYLSKRKPAEQKNKNSITSRLENIDTGIYNGSREDRIEREILLDRIFTISSQLQIVPNNHPFIFHNGMFIKEMFNDISSQIIENNTKLEQELEKLIDELEDKFPKPYAN